MSIFFWFLIISVITLLVNLAFIWFMSKKESYHPLTIIITSVLGILICSILYLRTTIQGTWVSDYKLADTLEIETDSYQSIGSGSSSAHAFYSKDGIKFQIDGSMLLDYDVPAVPKTVEIYVCETVTGFLGCYLATGTDVFYILR